MAQQGYWMICEEVYAGDKSKRKPGVYIGMVEGFFDIHAMAATRLEVLSIIKAKLKHNIKFLLKCYQDIPEPSNSNADVPNCDLPNAMHFFIPLDDLGFNKSYLYQKVA